MELLNIDQAIRTAELAIQITPENDPAVIGYLYNLGKMLSQRYEQTRREQDIEESVQVTRRAVSTSFTLLGNCLTSLASKLILRYEEHRQTQYLEEAVRVRRQATECTPGDHPSRPVWLNNLGVDLGRLYDARWRIEDIDEAILIGSEALEGTPIDNADRAGILFNLGTNLTRRHERTETMPDIEGAIYATRQALVLTPELHPKWASYSSSLGVQLRLKYMQTRRLQDLFEAVQLASQAVNATQDDYPDRASLLNNLGNTLVCRYEAVGDMNDVERAIQGARDVLEMTPEGHPRRALALSNLGTYLTYRYEARGEEQDIAEAIRVTEEALELSPEGDPDRPTWLGNLGTCLSNRYGRTEDLEDINRSIQVTREALNSSGDNHPSRAKWSSNLGIRLGRRYERIGDLRDLNEAVELLRNCLDLVPDNHVNRAGILNNLGNQLGRQYERTGELGVLEEAIQMLHNALDLTPQGHNDRAMWLQNLAKKLNDRFRRTAELQNLREAIQAMQQSVQATPANNPELGRRLGNLGNMFEAQYERTEKMEDLEGAIGAAGEALQATPRDHADRPWCLSNLSQKLGRRFERIGDVEDIEQAVELVREAIELTPRDHPLRALLMNNLGIELSRRYNSSTRTEDMDEAISAIQEAVQLTPRGHPNRAAWSNNVANKLFARYTSKMAMKDLNDACTSYLEAWNNLNAIPFHRIEAASWLVRLLPLQGEIEDASRLAKEAIDLLPQVSTRSLNLEDRQWTLSTFSGMAADACSLLLETFEPEQALQYLESGRAVILGELMNDRSDISKLKEQHPGLASEYEGLRDEVNAPIDNGAEDDDVSNFHRLNRRREAVTELDSCIERIRALEGWNHFLRGLTIAEMKECAADGVVVVNVTPRRSDAIIISSTVIVIRELSDLFRSDTMQALGVCDGTYRDITAEAKISSDDEFLSWLWSNCVKVVLEDIDRLLERQCQELLRVWWIGVGAASIFPFHAAGLHRDDSRENTLSRTVSSYTPTIKALSYSKSQALRLDPSVGNDASILVVTMPTTPGQTLLAGVDREKHEIDRACNGVYKYANLECPTAGEVLERIPRSDIVHFACHGSSDPTHPSESHLLLMKDSDAGPVVDELTLSSIARLPTLGRAWIAYLSACSTAEVKARRLADEGLHIASAFQVSGFPHVIGTLWSVADNVSIRVAQLFYEALTSDGEGDGDGDGEALGRPSNRTVADALRTAILQVRAEYPDPSLWAAYIHSGS